MDIGVSVDLMNLEHFERDYGHLNVEIEHVQICGLPAVIDDSVRRCIMRFKSDHQNMALSLHAYPYNLSECVMPVREAWLKLATDLIHLAVEVKAKFVNFHAGYGPNLGRRIDHQACLRQFTETLKVLLEIAETNQLEIHLENLYQVARNSDFGYIGDRTGDFDYFLDQLKSPSFKICYDYGHGNLDESGIHLLRRFHKHVGSLHAHDNDQISDIHWPIGASNLGTINWKSEFEFLKEVEYQGVFILESYYEDQLKSLEFIEKRAF